MKGIGLALARNSISRKLLGEYGSQFLEISTGAIARILPHVELTQWSQEKWKPSETVWKAGRKQIEVRIAVGTGKTGSDRSYTTIIKRKVSPDGIGKIARTLDTREYDICKRVVESTSSTLEFIVGVRGNLPFGSVSEGFDEKIIAGYLRDHHKFELDILGLFSSLHSLAEQTYENVSISFGCIIDPHMDPPKGARSVFPSELFKPKKYRALSDGFRTGFHVSGTGKLICGLADLEGHGSNETSGVHYYPEWAAALANASTKDRCGICLTRNGDLLIFEEGSLRFTYRFGKWQYWNHHHLIDLMLNLARVQKVPLALKKKVLSRVYRAAIDASFRRKGALFVCLGKDKNLRGIVRSGDAIGDTRKYEADTEFDRSIRKSSIQDHQRAVVSALASLDGAVVINSRGQLRAYGVVLDPKKRGQYVGAEGSRTKAAIGASNFGLAIKVSSDGDITVFHAGKEFVRI